MRFQSLVSSSNIVTLLQNQLKVENQNGNNLESRFVADAVISLKMQKTASFQIVRAFEKSMKLLKNAFNKLADQSMVQGLDIELKAS